MSRIRPVLAAAAAAVLLAVPAAHAQLELPDAPVGGMSRIDCVSVCIVATDGQPCDSSANQGGQITQLSANVPFFVTDLKRGPAPTGSSNACAAGTANPTSLPVNLAPGQVVFFDIEFRPTAPGLYDGLLQITGNRGGESVGTNVPLQGQATGGNPTAPCVPGNDTLCLQDGRFKVQVSWRTNQGTSGMGNVVPYQVDDSGMFWFFNSNNWETVVKVLDGCGVNEHYWIFASGLTNVETRITVTDTDSGQVRQYLNPQGTPFKPVQDTSAFATCP